MMRHRNIKGFTMLEVVIAIAITSIIVIAIASTTQAITFAANRQSKTSATVKRWDKIHEVLHADLKGWLPVKVSADALSDDVVLCSFASTADYHGINPSQIIVTAGATIRIQYVQRQTSDGLTLFRLTKLDDDNLIELPLGKARSPIEIQFYDGVNWSEKQPSGERPACVLLKMDGRSILVRL